jgi:hypothetical protein
MTIPQEEETSDMASEPVVVAQEPMAVPKEPADVDVDVEQDSVDVEQDPTDLEQGPVDVEQEPEQKPEPIDMDQNFDVLVEQNPIDVPQEESKDEEDVFVDEEAPMKTPGATSIDGPGADSSAPTPVAQELKAQDPALKKETPKKPEKEINPDFKDVHETGKWGQISRSEMYIVLLVVVLVVAGVVAGIVVAVGNNDGDTEVIAAPAREEVTEAPSPAPSALSLEDQLVSTLKAIDANNIAFVVFDDFPEDDTNPAVYEGLQDDPTATPASRAMSWLLFSDGRNIKDETIYRWVLASVYYSMGGENWPNQQNWLSDESICQWQGLDCDAFDVLRELDLSDNSLEGRVPFEFAMLDTLQAVALRSNQLSGELNGAIFGFLPRLTILYLNNNQFSGEIPVTLRDNGVLRK